MQWRRTSSPEPVINFLYDRINSQLTAGKSVLWLVPGGSNISVVVATATRLQTQDTSRLTLSLTDERYGPSGHADSNWQQLLDAGFVLPGAHLQPVITGKNVYETTAVFSKFLETAIASHDFRIGFFGLGSDGHTAGILPGSSALTATESAVHFISDPYERITMTPAIIRKLDEAVVYAKGSDKLDQLKLLATDTMPDLQVAQILKTVPQLTIFNDYEGDPL